VPHDDELEHRRARALLGLLGLQALRTVEITRANVANLQRHDDSWALLVHGKYHDRLVFLRPDVVEAVRAYLAARGQCQAAQGVQSRAAPYKRHPGLPLTRAICAPCKTCSASRLPRPPPRYARVVDRARTNPALKTPVEL